MRPEDEVPEDEYVPEESLRDVTTGLFCFLSPDRVCGAECAAFVTSPRLPVRSELNEQQAHCELMLCMERMGRNITVIAQIAAEGVKKKSIAEADKQRTGQFDTKPAPTPATASPFPGWKKP